MQGAREERRTDLLMLMGGNGNCCFRGIYISLSLLVDNFGTETD